jgi:hypothetical protein
MLLVFLGFPMPSLGVPIQAIHPRVRMTTRAGLPALEAQGRVVNNCSAPGFGLGAGKLDSARRSGFFRASGTAERVSAK